MRRKDREITDYQTMLEVLAACSCIRLGLADKNGAYIVPVNFGMAEENGKLTLYFHGAKEGRKINMMKKQPRICFEADRKHEIVTGEKACDYSFLYQSVRGYGEAQFIEGIDEQEMAMNCIMRHYSGKDSWEFNKEIFEKTNVMKIIVSEWSCKEH